jgi:hypothetical protein
VKGVLGRWGNFTKKASTVGLRLFSREKFLAALCPCKLFTELGKTLVELVNAASGVNELHFSGKERVRLGRNFELHQWVLVAIFPSDGVLGLCARVSHPGLVAREILENDLAVILWMDIVFHVEILFFLNERAKIQVFPNRQNHYSGCLPVW